MTLTLDPAIENTIALLEKLFARKPLEHVSIRLWDGTLWPDDTLRPATVALNHPGSLRAMLEDGTAKGLAEAYVHGEFEVEGDMEKAIEMAVALEDRPTGWLESLSTYYRMHRLPVLPREKPAHGRKWAGTRHSQERDRDVVSYHYDVSNDFYRLWLDHEMAYSCAYFETPGATLDGAQIAKFRMICRKLRLKPGQRLLDIGCGWGGLARLAAREFGVSVVGVTLSSKQEELARDLTAAAHLSDRVTIQVRDYRELGSERPFDAIASVGMAEHVGRENLPEYFETALGLLKPGGTFLNHAIGEGVRAKQFRGPSFIDEFVFPDSDIPALPVVLAAAEKSGFEIRDVENLREHYVRTLRRWVERLESNSDQARELVGEETFRVWRLYMAGSAQGFDHGHLAIYQTLLSKPHGDGRSGLPFTRREWYRG